MFNVVSDEPLEVARRLAIQAASKLNAVARVTAEQLAFERNQLNGGAKAQGRQGFTHVLVGLLDRGFQHGGELLTGVPGTGGAQYA